MPRGKKPIGLRVKYCENVAVYEEAKKNKSKFHTARAFIPNGWFVQVWFAGNWHPLMDLRFVRERDALRAAQALTEAGLTSYSAMQKVHPMTVKQVACEALQW